MNVELHCRGMRPFMIQDVNILLSGSSYHISNRTPRAPDGAGFVESIDPRSAILLPFGIFSIAIAASSVPVVALTLLAPPVGMTAAHYIFVAFLTLFLLTAGSALCLMYRRPMAISFADESGGGLLFLTAAGKPIECEDVVATVSPVTVKAAGAASRLSDELSEAKLGLWIGLRSCRFRRWILYELSDTPDRLEACIDQLQIPVRESRGGHDVGARPPRVVYYNAQVILFGARRQGE